MSSYSVMVLLRCDDPWHHLVQSTEDGWCWRVSSLDEHYFTQCLIWKDGNYIPKRSKFEVSVDRCLIASLVSTSYCANSKIAYFACFLTPSTLGNPEGSDSKWLVLCRGMLPLSPGKRWTSDYSSHQVVQSPEVVVFPNFWPLYLPFSQPQFLCLTELVCVKRQYRHCSFLFQK